MAEKRIISFNPLKNELAQRQTPFGPLELYLHPDWNNAFDPKDTVYVTAAASSGGYRAYMDIWGTNGSDAWRPNAHRQHTIIGMNTALITDMVERVQMPIELQNKSFVIPHSIGTDIPGSFGTLLGKNEADLMMQWMMRIGGVNAQTATAYYETMMNDHAHVREIIGDPRLPKKEKVPCYIELIQTFLDTKRGFQDKGNPFAAIMLGLDWKNSLGSLLEAAAALKLEIPLYEMVIDKNHPDKAAFMDSYRLKKIVESQRIHFPHIEGSGTHLISAVPRSQDYIGNMIGHILLQID